ncbi:helix-turn-helix domain-containing protein [Streptomyces sp. APSN-46.1]|uniref:helix-turn-helix domain-containing protein n=1 Tax=Streptomyces sp. APSN-46.1 TaxID=2929049 RepID=UPI001FB2F41D|nr:helix-turn-helix transcriptional regulator [Streptomyces sp. APSN-46.1]MCJ1677058.1 helix-turn-helix domain-containing protein [Streptomyces sp. APSN-46.1]
MPAVLEEQEEIGGRIRRRRLAMGLTQSDLGTALGHSQGWVSKVEKGLIELDRAAVISRMASALHCHPNDLIRRPYETDSSASRWQQHAHLISRELRRYDLPPVFEGTPRPAAELWQETVRLGRLRDAAAHSAVLAVIPDLLRETRALTETADGHEREQAWGMYAVLCKCTHTAARDLGHAELTALACERAVWAADLSGDPLMRTVAAGTRVSSMWSADDYADALALSDQSLSWTQDAYEARDPMALRVWGAAQLRAAVSAARAGQRDETQTRLGYAREAADRMDALPSQPFDPYSLNFSSGNVTLHEIAMDVEMGDHVGALEKNRTADQAQIAAMPNSRRGHHHMDLARAYMWENRRDKAFEELTKAEKAAKELVTNHPMARATLRKILHAERTATREAQRSMATRFHLDA